MMGDWLPCQWTGQVCNVVSPWWWPIMSLSWVGSYISPVMWQNVHSHFFEYKLIAVMLVRKYCGVVPQDYISMHRFVVTVNGNGISCVWCHSIISSINKCVSLKLFYFLTDDKNKLGWWYFDMESPWGSCVEL